jgi:hypothetical protein
VKRILCALIGVFVVTFAILWWPRLDPRLVLVSRSEMSGDEMVLEYRMAQAFAVGLRRGIRKPAEPLREPGIRVGGSTVVRSEKVALFSSSFDMLRGEHYVRLRLERGPKLTIEAGGKRLEVAAWSAPDASRLIWEPPSPRRRFGDGNGDDVLYFVRSEDHEEYLILYAGTNIEHLLD